MTLKERCPILHFGDLGDERGKLVVIEGAQAIPFDIKRVFYIYDSDSTVVRGQHANKESEFVLINVAGKSKVRITDGNEELNIKLDKPMMGVYIPKMIWKDMYDFSSDSVLLVLASTHYDGSEYIRDYQDYINLPDVRIMTLADRSQPLLSLCMPTNGVPEWVFPSLDKIYEQGIDEELFEVVIMDNGHNCAFVNMIKSYGDKHANLRYYHTDKELFLSEPESYKKATGKLIKFVNHRCMLEPGAMQYLIDLVKQYGETKPVIYCTNGATRQKHEVKKYNTFGEFVEALEYFSTWSSGMTIWKDDMDSMANEEEYNYLFPHTNILFHRKDAESYIIDGTKLWTEIKQGKKPKGNYNVFYAFAVEYLYILLELVRNGDLSTEQFLKVKKDNLGFLTQLYKAYIIKKEYCSYDLTDYSNSINTFYSEKELRANLISMMGEKAIRKIRKRAIKVKEIIRNRR